MAGCVSVEASASSTTPASPASEALEDRPAGGVGKGGEGAAQRIVGSHYHKLYNLLVKVNHA